MYGVLVFEAMATFIGQVSVLSLIALFGAATTAMVRSSHKPFLQCTFNVFSTQQCNLSSSFQLLGALISHKCKSQDVMELVLGFSIFLLSSVTGDNSKEGTNITAIILDIYETIN